MALKRHWERCRDDYRVVSERVKVISLTADPTVVCQPPCASLAAIVPTVVNQAAYESKLQPICLPMKPNSSQLLVDESPTHLSLPAACINN